ncbi:Rho GTPase-activating protein 26 [Gryllus bimaculatus]|nr:Rho GTPase-activating protein 26 [Gryllus bimaculatus]
MGVGLKPLEFYECLGDSPYFREKLHAHEQELQRTSHQIKGLIRELKDLLAAAKHLSKAQRTLSHSLQTFDFPCIGDETDDEMVIAKSLKDLGNLIAGIEDHRDIMLDHAYDQIILPLERFRKEHIGRQKEVREADCKVLYESRTIPQPIYQETRYGIERASSLHVQLADFLSPRPRSCLRF